MKNWLWLLCFLAVFVQPFSANAAKDTAVKLAPVNNRDYVPVVHELLNQAQKSIKIVLFQMRYYAAYPGSSTNSAMQELAQAAARGVEVSVILDATGWNKDNAELNRLTGDLLKAQGVKVYFDSPVVTTHDKFVLVDKRWVLIGSTNWSNTAFDKNNEANVLIDDKSVYQIFLAEFDRILAESSESYPYLAPVQSPFDSTLKDQSLLTIHGQVAYTRPGLPEKTMDIILTDSSQVNVQRDITETMQYLDAGFFARLSGQNVALRAVMMRETPTAVDIFDPDMRQKFIAQALLTPLEKKPELKPIAKKWLTVNRVRPLVNAAYFEPVHQALQNARNNIDIIMMDVRYYNKKPPFARRTERQDPPSLTNVLQKDLIAAEDRHIQVRLTYDEGAWRLPADKKDFLAPVLKAGAEIYKDSPDLTTHCKLIVVDNETVILGSTNWTYPALEEGNEAALLIESKELNQFYRAYIQSVVDTCQQVDKF